ncbi:MAG: phosphomevalonate kinase, partial [Streptococcus sp.]
AVMDEFLQSQSISLSPFSLTITGKMERNGKKLGLGSSGSVVVVTIRAIASLFDVTLSADETFKLAAYVLLKRGDNGSMGDVACIAYEDLIYYQSFNRKKIAEQINELPLEKIVAQDWGYIIRTIHPQLPCDFLVGWTREPAISSVLINQVKAKISSIFLTQTQEEVLRLEKALLVGEKEIVKQSLEKVSCLLLQLSPAIYNEKLRALKRSSRGLDCMAKSSGAGGGDCGIALSFDSEASQILVERWQAAGIEVLYKERWDR